MSVNLTAMNRKCCPRASRKLDDAFEDLYDRISVGDWASHCDISVALLNFAEVVLKTYEHHLDHELDGEFSRAKDFEEIREFLDQDL